MTTPDPYPTDPLTGVTAGDLNWLAGAWLGQRGEDLVEEHWSGVAGGALMGMFRWLHGDAVRFYELLVIEPQDGGLVLRIKHFDPGLVGWEEKDRSADCDLVQLSGHEAVFLQRGREEHQWLLYRREADHLITYFTRSRQPPPEEDQFHYSKLA